MDLKLRLFLAGAALASSTVQAGSVDGVHYTNFGLDLVAPIFLAGDSLEVYRTKSDSTALSKVSGEKAISMDDRYQSCIQIPADGWVRCSIPPNSGWVKRDTFLSGGQYQPVTSWPIRYWLFVASSGGAAEETLMIEKAARKSPYLVRRKEFNNIFFHVLFDREGNAISPKTGKRTGDRIFVVDGAAYLAPTDPVKRNGATWLFLNYYHEKLGALCPARDLKSCRSVVNLGPDWPGIKALYSEPPPEFRRHHADERWYGDQEVAFARHGEPVRPLMYRVPDDVWMPADGQESSEAKRIKNRAKPFCIADCSK